jgi:GxxExxY protein
MKHENEISSAVIGASIEIHRLLGPGLLESAYEECLAEEMSLRGIAFKRQKPMPIVFKERHLECGYRADFLVEGKVIVEIKAVEDVAPVHLAQVLTYLKLGDFRLGLLINFNVVVLKDGIHRIANRLKD